MRNMRLTKRDRDRERERERERDAKHETGQESEREERTISNGRVCTARVLHDHSSKQRSASVLSKSHGIEEAVSNQQRTQRRVLHINR